MSIDDIDRRRISLQVREVTDIAAIHMDCSVEDGLAMPGLKDTRAIVRLLDGTFSTTPEDGIFSLDELLPQWMAKLQSERQQSDTSEEENSI